MNERKYLNEENYQRGKKKIKTIALIIFVLGLLIGGSIIALGISKYGSSKKQSLTEQLAVEKENVNNKRTELEKKIKPVQDEIKSLKREKFTGFDDAYYARQDKIEELEKSIEEDKDNIKLIDLVVDGVWCSNPKGKNNIYTSKYCEITEQLDKDGLIILFYMIGAFVIITTCMISGSIFMFGKRREIMAFTAQQVMPVAKEGIDEMAPTIGNAAGEIAKGIKKGLNDADKE